MWCPNCNSEKTTVVHTDKSYVVERYRKCESCNYTFATVEGIKFDPNLPAQAKYSDDEIARILKKRHSHQRDFFHEQKDLFNE